MGNVVPVVQGVDEIQGDTRTLRTSDVMSSNGMSAAVLSIAAPAAPGTTGILGALAGNSATMAFAVTQPDVPRNVAVAFALGWNGGDVVLTGTDAKGVAVTETIVAVANSTVVGSVAFKTITSAVKTLVGAAAAGATGGPGSKLGLWANLFAPFGVLVADGVTEEATFDVTYATVLPTTLPDGVVNYVVVVPV